MRKILTDDTKRELSMHGSEQFPMTVSHDDLWDFEGKRVPVHWHGELEFSLPRKGTAVYQVGRKRYEISPGEGLLLNQNVPHSCYPAGRQQVRYSTVLVRPDFLYGEFGSDVERKCFRPFLQNSAVPCIRFGTGTMWERDVLQKLDLVEEIFDRGSYCYELKIKGLLCDICSIIFEANREKFSEYVPANQLELDRLEQMLDYLNTHFDSVVTLQELADQVHLSREVCCRLFHKLTGKTVTGYLEEYRVGKSFALVQSGQYSMTQIADMTGFSSASRFAAAFRKQFGCNPGAYRSFTERSKAPVRPGEAASEQFPIIKAKKENGDSGILVCDTDIEEIGGKSRLLLDLKDMR